MVSLLQEGDLNGVKQAIADGAFLPGGPAFIDKVGKKNALQHAAQYDQMEVPCDQVEEIPHAAFCGVHGTKLSLYCPTVSFGSSRLH